MKLSTTNYKSPTTNGFTLIELLLYITISATILLVMSAFLPIFFHSRIKNQTIAEVEQQGAQIMQLLSQTIRNAQGINFPLSGVNSSSLSLSYDTYSKNPTIFYASAGKIYITEGADFPIALTSSRLVASDLVFYNLFHTATPGVIRIEFTLTHINPENRNEYNYAKTFYSSASLR